METREKVLRHGRIRAADNDHGPFMKNRGYYHAHRVLKYKLQDGERQQYEQPIMAKCVTRCLNKENADSFDRYSLREDSCAG